MTGLDVVSYEVFFKDPGGMLLYVSDLMSTPEWQVTQKTVVKDDGDLETSHVIMTPEGVLTSTTNSNIYTTWITEHLIKEKEQIKLLSKYMPYPRLDINATNKQADRIGDDGILRTHIFGYGQPGCWQDACCLFGTVEMIMATYDDPAWVHEFLGILMNKKLNWVGDIKGARIDILELGGGDASDTVISPSLFDEFVHPYDKPIIEAIHNIDVKVVYHTCGGMMNILPQIEALEPDGTETLTPKEMGGNANLKIIKEKLGPKMFMQGGFDQLHGFVDCDLQDTRKLVHKCFEEAGSNGGFVLCPSDHFFDADLANVLMFAQAARECSY